MKKKILFLILLAIGFFSGYFVAFSKRKAEMPVQPSFSKAEVFLRFHPAPYPSEYRAFCIIILARNNGAYLEKTLQSALSQKYECFRVIYVDDASDDGSTALAQELIQNSPNSGKVRFICNPQAVGALESISNAIVDCLDHEIVVVLHGEDWLAHPWVLQRLNQYYADPDLWISYGQCLQYPSFEKEDEDSSMSGTQPIHTSSCRFSRPCTFYSALFKKIAVTDFMERGKHSAVFSEIFYMIPMMEMAEGHAQYIPDVLCMRNVSVEKTFAFKPFAN